MGIVYKTLTLLLVLGTLNVSGQGFLKKLDNLKNKTNYLDNKYREDWIPFPQDNYHIKSITCAYGETSVYTLDFVYDDNALLTGIDLYIISPKTGNKIFYQRVKDISYNKSSKEVVVKEYRFQKKSTVAKSFHYYKMDKGKIIASTSTYSETPLEKPIPYQSHFNYNEAGKPITKGSKFNEKNQLIADSLIFNGAFIKTTIDYNNTDPLLFSKKEETRMLSSDTVTSRNITTITKKNTYDESVVISWFKGVKEKLYISRDILGRVIAVTDNSQERLLKATIEYEDRTSNEKLFCFNNTNPTDIYQFGNAAMLYNIPFYLFYFDE